MQEKKGNFGESEVTVRVQIISKSAEMQLGQRLVEP